MSVAAFAGQVRPIGVRFDCGPANAGLRDDIALIAPHWPAATASGDSDIVVTPAPEGFAVAVNAYASPPYAFATRLAAAHGVVGGMIGAYVVQDPATLALHAASVLAKAGFVALLGDHGAGKSTLAVALAAAGAPLGGDDRLVLRLSDDKWSGTALGLRPKLRRPLPAEAPASFVQFADRHQVGADGEMQFIDVPGLVRFGATAPLAAIVLLRRGGGDTRLSPLARAALMKELVTTGFAPHHAAAARLMRFSALATVPAFQLDYGSSFAATDVLMRAFPP